MTTDQHRAQTLDRIGDTRPHTQWAAIEGAAIRGELGVEAQLLAMSEQYKALRAAGRTDEARAVKAQAIRIHAAAQEPAQ